MSTTIADYIVLLDGRVLLETEGVRSKFFRFNLSSDFSAEGTSKNPVLTYRVRVPSKDTRLNIYVNPEQTESTSSGFPVNPPSFYTLTNGYLGELSSIFPRSLFTKGKENTIVFTISGDGHKFGDIEIGNVVLLYQRLMNI